MATKIEWTDETWNPIRGCSRVSEGCRNCYAEKVAYRFSGPGLPYEGLVRIARGGDSKEERRLSFDHHLAQWNGKIKFVEEHLLDPLKWKGRPIYDSTTGKRVGFDKGLRIFVNSMSDLFHENVTDEMLDRIFAVMALCPQHTFQVLTKRPERMLTYLTSSRRGEMSKLVSNAAAWPIWSAATAIQAAAEKPIPGPFRWTEFAENDTIAPWPLPNVWLGVSVEDQKTADERIPLLLQTPAAVRFISAEPLLGQVDPTNVMDRRKSKALKINCVEAKEANPAHSYLVETMGADYPYARLDWVICGGESGPGARPMHPDWARRLRDQCVAAGVPFFFKQWGEWAPFSTATVHEFLERHPGTSMKTPTCLVRSDGAMVRPYCMADAPGHEMIRIGKKAAGHLLDGKEWHQFPEAANASI